MASKTAILAVKIVADEKDAVRGLENVGKSSGKFTGAMAKAAPAARKVVAAYALVGGAAVKQASDLQQSSGAVEAVFGKQSAAVKKLSEEAANRLGLAKSQYQQTAAVFASQLKNMGVAEAELVPTTDKLIGLGGDLAAMFGGTTSDAVDALSSLLRGERDPIEKYGVSIKQADINARLAATGQDKLTGAAKRTAETEATLALLMKQTSAAQGQRAREANTLASQSERAIANLKNAGADLGTVLLPIVAQAAGGLASLAGVVGENQTAFTILAGVVGGVALAVLAVNTAVKVWTAIQTAATAAQWLWNAAMSANPIGIVVLAIAALTAGLVLAYKKSDTFRNAVHTMSNLVVGYFKVITTPIRTLIGWIQDLIDWIGKIDWPSPPSWVSDIGSFIGRGGPGAFAPAPAYVAADGRGGPGSSGALRLRTGGNGPMVGVNVTVTGFVGNADQLARAIRDALDGLDRRRGVTL